MTLQLAQEATKSTFLLLARRELLLVIALRLALTTLVVGVASASIGVSGGAAAAGACSRVEFGVEAPGVGFVAFVGCLLGLGVGVVGA